jgi:hypothetical protein
MFVRKTQAYLFFDVTTNVSLGDFNKPLAAEAWIPSSAFSFKGKEGPAHFLYYVFI